MKPAHHGKQAIRLLHVTNYPSGQVLDGGLGRERALEQFLQAKGAQQLVVMDKSFNAGLVQRTVRLSSLIKQIHQQDPDLLVLEYPSYPFFWKHKVTKYFWASVTFALMLRREADRAGFKVVVDVRDLPVFQYKDLGFPLEMSPRMLKWYDNFIFKRADRLWVCSESLADLMHNCYGIHESKLIVALNGYQTEVNPSRSDSPTLRFAYAGSLNPDRGIKHLIESFLSANLENCELHLCGLYGNWILDSYKDARLIHHGSLSDEEASAVVSSCDLGLIPYPERGYYNLAFATKLSFYMGLGLPVICSNARETASHVRRLGVGLCWPLQDFSSALSFVSENRGQLSGWRRRISEVRSRFSWFNIYQKALDDTVASLPLSAT